MKNPSLAAAAALVLALTLPAQVEPGDSPQRAHPWFETVEVDMGRHLEGEVAKGRFDFSNPRDTEQEFRSFQPSCTCSKAVLYIGDDRFVLQNKPNPNTIYKLSMVDGAEQREQVPSVKVPPGAEGYLEMEVDLRGIVGPKEATITVRTSDPQAETVILKGKASAYQFFRLVPPEVNLNKMNWNEQRQFTVQITSPLQPDFEITGMDPLPEKMEVAYEKEMRDGAAVWTLRGTYGPDVDPKAGGGIIQLRTNVEGRTIAVRVMAWVDGPLEIRPSTFVPFGRVRKGQGATQVVEFEANDDFDLQIDSVELKNLSVADGLVTTSIEKDGKVCKLSIHISPDVPRSLVRGDIVVHLNHPSVKTQELQFNGFVR